MYALWKVRHREAFQQDRVARIKMRVNYPEKTQDLSSNRFIKELRLSRHAQIRSQVWVIFGIVSLRTEAQN